MTVQNTIVKNVYVGNGSVTVFPYTFALNKDDGEFVSVVVGDENDNEVAVSNFKVDTTNLTVTYPFPSGDPLPSGHRIAIRRCIPNKQELNLENQGPFFAEDIEKEFDRVVMMIQQLQEESDRAIKGNQTSTTTAEEMIEQIHEDRLATHQDMLTTKGYKEDVAADLALSISARDTTISYAGDAEGYKDQAQHYMTVAQNNANAAQNAATAAQGYAQSASDSATQAESSAGGSQYWAQLAHEYTEPLRHVLGNMFEYDENGGIMPVENPLTGTDPHWEVDENGGIMPVAMEE